MIRSPPRHAAKLRTTGASRKIATRVATPARLRAMAARERHVGRIVGRAGAIAGLRAADTWTTKAVLTRFMSAPVGAAYWLPVGHDNSRREKS